MFALFVIALIQVAAAKDLIQDLGDGKFFRIEKGKCWHNQLTGTSIKYINEDGDKVTLEEHTTKDCSGKPTSTSVLNSTQLQGINWQLKDCPKWTGYLVTDSDAKCANKDTNTKIYLSDGCHKKSDGTSLKYLIEKSALREDSYKKANCEEYDKTAEYGKCDECAKANSGYQFVKCGTVSKMILAVLAVLFFLF